MNARYFVCEKIEALSPLTRLEARGTVRLALKQAGFGAANVTAEQMRVVVERVLAEELRTRGVDDAEAICQTLVAGLTKLEGGAGGDSPEAIFARLGGGSTS